MALSAVAALALFLWHPTVVVSVGCAMAYALLNAIGRPALFAVLADVPAESRGTVLGLNGATASVGWVGAASFGALMFAGAGFGGFGPLTAALSLAAAAGALYSKRLDPGHR